MNISSLVKKNDSENMLDSIKNFSRQFFLLDEIMGELSLKNQYENISRILVLGMGGSAIGANIVSEMLKGKLNISIDVNRGYFLPQWVDKYTLVIVYSYSGNTEETLSALNFCDKEIPKVIITSGGKLLEISDNENIDCIKLPSGEQPRAALGYSISAYIGLLYKLEIIGKDVICDLKNAVKEVQHFTDSIIADNSGVLDFSNKIFNKLPIIYSENESTKSIGVRFANQLQENSKILAYSSVLPELNHNEIEGFQSNPIVLDNVIIIWLVGYDESLRSLKRREITSEIISSFNITQDKITIDASSRLEYLLKLIHFVDWVSFYGGIINDVDPSPVPQISTLKNKLA